MIRAAVVGATGYTGAELVRLLGAHGQISLGGLYGQRTAGKAVADVLPSLRGFLDGEVLAFEPSTVEADAVFCALPHGASAPIVAELRERGHVVFDLSADFRLRDLAVYQKWYGEHGAPARIEEAVYGLPELHREAIRRADLVAVPGCYPTTSVLPIAPLLRAGLLDVSRPIIVDAKSGVSGAGRKVTARTHYAETGESFRAYATAGRHRHTPEIEQELSLAGGQDVRVIFSPHLLPMIRGILSTSYLTPAAGEGDAIAFTETAREFFRDSPSVRVLDPGSHPDTSWVRGSNRALISYATDPRSGWVVAQCAIDNLVKGASGQAIQCANVRFGFEEGAGLELPATWP